MKKNAFVFIAVLLLAVSLCKPASALLKETERASLELLARETGETIEVFLRILPKNGWNIYSNNPGEYGFPTIAEWTLYEHKLISEKWSLGNDILYEGFGINVYDTMGSYIAVLEKAQGEIPHFEVLWTACKEECVPESLSFELSPNVFVRNFEIDSDAFVEDVKSNELNLFDIIFMAFLGGVILNLMPCVFPVLFIKIISLTKHNGKKIRVKEAFLYLLGVLVCFLVMAAVLSFLRANGQHIGWGFQLQSPYFIVFLAVIFFILTLMFLDIIELNYQIKYIPSNSFMTGLLAVLIASPCTAPFMGAAIGWTMTSTRSAYIYYPVFFALGLGYALPFFFAELYPKYILKLLPKPGFWMVVLKRVFAIPVFITFLWLVWILFYNGSKDNVGWKIYQEKEVEELVENGENVFINFTAKWCITCLVNEKTTFDGELFKELAAKNNIHLYKADWTNRSKDIAQSLAKYKRSSIPLYIYYTNKKYTILPQLLTDEVIENIFR